MKQIGNWSALFVGLLRELVIFCIRKLGQLEFIWCRYKLEQRRVVVLVACPIMMKNVVNKENVNGPCYVIFILRLLNYLSELETYFFIRNS